MALPEFWPLPTGRYRFSPEQSLQPAGCRIALLLMVVCGALEPRSRLRPGWPLGSKGIATFLTLADCTDCHGHLLCCWHVAPAHNWGRKLCLGLQLLYQPPGEAQNLIV